MVREGSAYNYVGSSSWISLATPHPMPDPGQLNFTFAHIVPGMYMPTGTMQAAGNSYQWARDQLGELEIQAGQMVKLCADSAMQIDVEDSLRGHVFAVQDALFWMAFLLAVTAAAAVMPADGHSAALVLAGSALYLAGLATSSRIARRRV